MVILAPVVRELAGRDTFHEPAESPTDLVSRNGRLTVERTRQSSFLAFTALKRFIKRSPESVVVTGLRFRVREHRFWQLHSEI